MTIAAVAQTRTVSPGGTVAAGRASPGPANVDIIMLGDSLTADSYPSNAGRVSLPMALAPGRLIYNAGIANDTLADILARVGTDVIDRIADRDVVVVFRGGTNSVGSGTFEADYQAILDALLADARVLLVICLAVPPKGLSGGSTIVAHNAAIEALCAGNARLTYAADSVGLGDGSYNADPSYYVAAESANPIHMNALGAYTQALVQAAAFPSMFGTRSEIRPTTGDNHGDNPASSQWVKNPLMAGTGTTADTWSVGAAGGGSTVTASIVAADGGDANTSPWQRMAVTGVGGANHTFTISTTLAHPAISSSGFPARLEVVAELRFNALDCTSLDRLSIYMQQGVNVPIPAWVIRLEGIGTVSDTLIVHMALERDLAQSFSTNTINLYFEVLSSGSAGSIGSIDVRNVAVNALAA